MTKEECKIYCCTVPSGMLLVRRNGKQVVCGNTPLEHALRCPTKKEYSVNNVLISELAKKIHDPSIVRDITRKLNYYANFNLWISHRKDYENSLNH